MKWYKCFHCKVEKPEDDFYNDKSRPNGKKPRCKPCDLKSRDKAKRAHYEREYWSANRERRRLINNKSNERNKERNKITRRLYLESDIGRAMYRKQTQKRYALRRAAYLEPVDPTQLYHDQSGVCYICSEFFSFKDMECDHVIPLARGGLHEKSNCKMACRRCNRRKGAKLLKELSYQMV